MPPVPHDDPPLTAEEELLVTCLELDGEQRSAWLAELERERPADAREVRARLEHLGHPELPRSHAPSTPSQVGPYRLLERVGAGGMGEVWRATDGERTVAVKLVRPELLWFEGAHRRFASEARTAARLDHPGLARVLDSGDEDGLPWLAMEWVEGVDLGALLAVLVGRPPAELGPLDLSLALRACSARGEDVPDDDPVPLPGADHPRQVAALLAQVARALQHAHERGVVHRDVKPSNVLVDGDGRAWLVDLGLARDAQVDRMTRSGAWLGSLPYCPPERLDGTDDSDPRGDVYSLGVTLQECLTLRSPFPGAREGEVRDRVRRGDRESLTRANPAVPADLRRIVRRATDLDPARRHPTAGDLAADLERVARGLPVHVPQAPLWLRAARRARRHPLRSAALGALLILLGLSLTWALRERDWNQRIRRLADAQAAERLLREAPDLWPPDPTRVEEVRDWLGRARAVLDRRAEHRATRDALLSARPVTHGAPPDGPLGDAARAQLLVLGLELDGLRARLTGGSLADLDPALLRGADAERAELLVRDPELHLEHERERIAQLTLLPAAQDSLERDQLAHLEQRRVELGTSLLAGPEARLENAFEQWRLEELERLLGTFERLDTAVSRVRDLQRRSESLRAIDPELQELWRGCREDIARHEPWAPLPLPDPLLRPWRRNPESGLWEFLLEGSGDLPQVDEQGRARWDGGTGIVLALVPGGPWEVGVPAGPERNLESARPRHVVALDPFLVAVHELTVGQLLRLAGPEVVERYPDDVAQHPARLSWSAADRWLRANGLDFPTEAQWERVARAGPLPTGPRASEVRPVAQGSPNLLGLFDLEGNTSEWCRDAFVWRGYRTLPARPGDGLRSSVLPVPAHSVRGANFTQREPPPPEQRVPGRDDALPSQGVRPVRGVRLERP